MLGLLPATFRFLEKKISDLFRPNSFIFEPKVEKKYLGVFSTQFVPLISILAPKILEEQNCQL
jgi:hypothetical protein